jgi:hypothetical protein
MSPNCVIMVPQAESCRSVLMNADRIKDANQRLASWLALYRAAACADLTTLVSDPIHVNVTALTEICIGLRRLFTTRMNRA